MSYASIFRLSIRHWGFLFFLRVLQDDIRKPIGIEKQRLTFAPKLKGVYAVLVCFLCPKNGVGDNSLAHSFASCL